LLYIIVALKAEAQSFVDKYKLKKEKLKNFVFYSNEDIRLLISGMGVENAREATQTLINYFDINDDDIYLNIGICGASKNYEIGELVEIGNISFKDIKYTVKEKKHSITCVTTAQSNSSYSIVDMESYGFYDAVIHNPAIKHIFILKVVSDHFEPQKVTKDSAKKLLFNKLDAINTLIRESK